MKTGHFYMVQQFSQTATRALGGIIGKTNILRNLGYSTFSKLYQTYICQILEYVSGMWGYKRFLKNEFFHNRAIWFSLGLHKYAHVLAFNMGWDSCEICWKDSVVSLWNRLLRLPSNRITNEILHWALSIKGERANEIFELL